MKDFLWSHITQLNPAVEVAVHELVSSTSKEVAHSDDLLEPNLWSTHHEPPYIQNPDDVQCDKNMWAPFDNPLFEVKGSGHIAYEWYGSCNTPQLC